MNRPRRWLPLLALTCISAVTGCFSHQVERDGNRLRRVIGELYHDQAMDNLARAHDYQPFVQLAYKDILNDDTDTYTGSGKVTDSLTANAPLAVTGLKAFTRGLEGVWSSGASGERERQMQFQADPVTDQNEIYSAYLAFAHNPLLFRKTSEEPTCGEAHVVYEKGDCYYWVPVEARDDFLALALFTSVMREEATLIDSYYERKIEKLEGVKQLEDEGFKADIVFPADAPVPNGSGTLVVPLENGQLVKIRVLRNEAEPEAAPVIKLSVQVLAEVPLTPENLRGATVRFYSDFYPPESPAPAVDLSPILRSLERIRQSE